MDLSEVFWVAFVGTVSGCLIKLASMAYKSKCKEVSCCCIKIVRDVEAEEREVEFAIQHTGRNQQQEEEKANV
jgi:hypothetical protein